ncbi:hypothetical protein PMI40_01172 [Herbaspirillum sp. YR522]|nr:hypothetical protein PMI40_01172 [Herbaspirillum sp. YR522]
MTIDAMARVPDSEQDYNTRWRTLPQRNTVRPVDPNVYVYNARFERNFKMPHEWMSDRLRHVDAVAWRVVPDYGSCRWDDERLGCERVALRCEIDLYFDHGDHGLPWHVDAPEFWDSNYWSSSYFLSKALRKTGGTTAMKQSSLPAQPFVGPADGKPMVWSRLSSGPGNDVRPMALLSYDRSALASTARVSLAGPCDDPPAALVLAPDGEAMAGMDRHFLMITLPGSWQERVAHALHEAAAAAKPAAAATSNK